MIAASLAKELRLVLADRGGLLALFAMPVVFMSVFGAVFGGREGDPMSLALYLESGERPAQIGAAASESGVFRISRLDSADAVRVAVAEGRADAGLVVPAQVSALAGQPAELYLDPAHAGTTSQSISGVVQGLVARAVYGVDGSSLVVVHSVGAEPIAQAAGFQLAVPGNAVLFGFFLSLTIAIAFLDERSSGTWRRLRAAPVSRWKLVLTKLVPYAGIGLLQMAFFFGFGVIVLGLQVGGSLLALVVLSMAMVVCATALGLFIASFSGTQKQIGGVGSIALLVMGLFGGAMVPRIAMPEVLQRVGLLTPQAWALDGFYALLLRDGGGLREVWVPVAVLFAFSAAFAAVAVMRFDRQG